ncbi:MAG: histidine kinase, partial [bacterium]|nr:histidine kinase [bacterium]
NGGSLLTADARVPLVILNTMVAGSMGGLGALAMSYAVHGRVSVVDLLGGCLAGLVAITPTAHCVTLVDAAVLSFIGGILCFLATRAIEKAGIDDAVNAFPVHGVPGVWGTLSVAIFGDLELIGTGLGRLEQLGVQCIGILAAMVWAFGLGYVLLRLVDRVVKLRVPEVWERAGLNVSEHGESTDQLELLHKMEHHRRTGDFSRPIEVELDSEVGDIARQYNLVLDRLSAAKIEAEQANTTKSRFLASMSHELRTPLNAIIGFSEMMTKKYFGELGSEKYLDYANEIHKSSSHLLDLVNGILNISTIESGGYNLTKSLVDLKTIARESARVASQSVREKNLKLVVLGDDGGARLEADPRAMRQVILNLLSNAIKHT